MKHTRTPAPAEPAWSIFPELAPAGSNFHVRSRPMATPEPAKVAPQKPVSPPSRAKEHGSVRSSTLSFSNMDEYGDLLVKYLRARKDVFIDRLHWALPHVDGMEFDQYDTPLCRWLIIHEFGEILAGLRLVPTTAKCGIYSYMLRDGQNGLLQDFPTDVLFFEAPVSDKLWEASRLFITDTVPAHRRSYVQYLLMRQMIVAASELDARQVIGIVPAVWSRWLRRLGLYAVPVGPKFRIEGMGSQAALFSIADQVQWATTDTGFESP